MDTFARLARFAPIATAAALLLTGISLVVATTGADRTFTVGFGLLRVDALSAYLLMVVGAVALTATWGGLAPPLPPRAEVRFGGLLVLFLGAMTLTLLADNLGVMWVGIEGTTIATAFLVGHHGGRAAVEAAWKYVVLGSVGIAIAFLGLVLLYAATASGGAPTLSWTTLMAHPGLIDPGTGRLALALAVLGLATKAGLAPMHSWLPDAHSQAPAQVSALMSGVLLSVAFYGILRLQAISDLALGAGLMRAMLLGGGLLSLTVAAALMIGQRDYKRLLAYSSTEHMGILAIGAGMGGPLAMAAVLLHILGHGLAKATLFVVAGRILADQGSARIDQVGGLLADRKSLAWPFLVGMGTLLGFPPGALFFTEVAILVAGWQQGFGWVSLAAAGLLVVVFAVLARHTLAMTLGAAPEARSDRAVDRWRWSADLPLAAALAGVAVVSFSPTVRPVIESALAVLGVAR
jgi:hydrogenase-4 component F